VAVLAVEHCGQDHQIALDAAGDDMIGEPPNRPARTARRTAAGSDRSSVAVGEDVIGDAAMVGWRDLSVANRTTGGVRFFRRGDGREGAVEAAGG
jgi:hypothetical protein